ncbi:MAG: RNA polymerase sigma factor [Myxococcales bacterium]
MEARKLAELSEEGAPPAAIPAAMRDLYRVELDYVWNALRRLGIRPNDLEDLLQEVFLRAFRDWQRYDPSRPVRPWLFSIAYHVAIDFLRLERHVREEMGPLPDVPDRGRQPDEHAAGSEARRQLDGLLAELSVDKRALIVMHELAGHTVPEISEALGVPLNTVYSRLRLARAELAALAQRRFGKEGT